MSSLMIVMNIPKEAETVMDIPDDYDHPLGTRAEVMTILKALFPDLVEETTNGWLRIPSQDQPINIGDKESVYTLGLRNAAYETLQMIYEHTGWRAMRAEDGHLFIPGEAF